MIIISYYILFLKVETAKFIINASLKMYVLFLNEEVYI